MGFDIERLRLPISPKIIGPVVCTRREDSFNLRTRQLFGERSNVRIRRLRENRSGKAQDERDRADPKQGTAHNLGARLE